MKTEVMKDIFNILWASFGSSRRKVIRIWLNVANPSLSLLSLHTLATMLTLSAPLTSFFSQTTIDLSVQLITLFLARAVSRVLCCLNTGSSRNPGDESISWRNEMSASEKTVSSDPPLRSVEESLFFRRALKLCLWICQSLFRRLTSASSLSSSCPLLIETSTHLISPSRKTSQGKSKTQPWSPHRRRKITKTLEQSMQF